MRLGRYTLLEAVGEGGMAEVFRARLDGPMGFKKTLAIKRIRDSLVREDEEHVRSLINEARIGGKLRHPNIVEVYELGEEDGHYYIAMEFVEGVNLTRIMEVAQEHRVRIPPSVVLDIGIQICRGLTYAHAIVGEEGEPLHLVHRDLKPSNIMVSLGGQAKLMDFGIAKASSNLFDTTETGIAKGTPLYMSPEQLRGLRPLRSASDLFSLGVLLYEMTTGRLLFAGRTIPEIITKVLNQPLKEAIDSADSSIPGIGPVLRRLLDRDVASRYQDAKEVQVELEHLIEWQDKDLSTAEIAQAVQKDRFPGSTRMDTTAASIRPIVEREDASEPAANFEGDPNHHLAANAGETLIDSYMRRQRRRRFGMLLTTSLAVAAFAAVAAYVFRGTLGVNIRIDSAQEALNAGDLDGALAQWERALRENPGREDARFGAAAMHTWARAPIEEITRSLEFANEDTPEAFARKYHAFGRAWRGAGNYPEAFGYLKQALDAAEKYAREAGTPIAPALLMETAEVALVLGYPDAAQAKYEQVTKSQPPGSLADLASSWSDAISEGRAALLGAELLYIDGRRAEAYKGLMAALDAADGSRERLQGDRLVWAYRALGDRNYELAANLVADLGPLSGEKERRRAAGMAKATALAGLGKTSPARKELDAALRLASSPEDRSMARLQVALALLRADGDASWASSLIEEAALEVGDDDVDVLFVVSLRDGALKTTTGPFQATLKLGVEARTGRFFPSGLSRAGPSNVPMIPPTAFAGENLSQKGLAAPFGPTFHPVDDTLLRFVYHPER